MCDTDFWTSFSDLETSGQSALLFTCAKHVDLSVHEFFCNLLLLRIAMYIMTGEKACLCACWQHQSLELPAPQHTAASCLYHVVQAPLCCECSDQ